MVVSGHFFANSEWDWIFVGPDGSIHFVSDDGRQHDTFRVGSPVYGVASETSRDETRLIVSSSEGVAAYRVEPYPEDHLPAAE